MVNRRTAFRLPKGNSKCAVTPVFGGYEKTPLPRIILSKFKFSHHPAMRIFIALAASLVLGPAFGANLLTNGGFESPVVGSSYALFGNGSTAINGWTVVDPVNAGGIAVQPSSQYSSLGVVAYEGAQFVDLTGITGQGKGLLSDAVSTTVGGKYQLSFALGEFWVLGAGTFGAAAVDVSINGVSQGSFINPISLSAPGTDWQVQTLQFTANSSSTRIQITNLTGPAYSTLGTGLDAVSLQSVSAPVPEASTWALMLAGLCFCLHPAVRHRRS